MRGWNERRLKECDRRKTNETNERGKDANRGKKMGCKKRGKKEERQEKRKKKDEKKERQEELTADLVKGRTSAKMSL